MVGGAAVVWGLNLMLVGWGESTMKCGEITCKDIIRALQKCSQ